MSSANLMLITHNLFINNSLYCILQHLVRSILAVYRKLYLAFLIHIAILTILERPPQAILRLYQKTFVRMQLLNLMLQDLHTVKLEADLLDKCQDLPTSTQ